MLTSTEKYFISLLRSVLTDSKAEVPADLNEFELVAVAQRQQLFGTIASAIEKQEGVSDIMKRSARQARYEAIALDMRLLAELQAIEEAMEQAEIPLMPLKGAVTKGLYPYSYFRTMSDLDILYHKEDEARIIEVMQKRGYTAESKKEEDNHLIFKKQPMIHVEYHTRLIHDGRKYDFLDDDWAHTHLKEGRSYIYEMSSERHYEHHLLHLLQHFLDGGVGARFIMDIYMYRNANVPIDRARLQADCEKMGIWKFAKNAEHLAEVWFGNEKATELDEKLGQFIIEGGLYGTPAHRETTYLSKAGGSKARYYLRAVFEPKERIKGNYPVLQKAPFLLPFCYVHRILKRLLTRRRAFKTRLKASISIDSEQAARQRELFEEIGV
ncbi:MAG: nucleotidyltransferase family protein [Clostridia bacterium]|nr:nucleotidyltransferase family protein [Clostridia bacterium]